jgi:hypothetical protein
MKVDNYKYNLGFAASIFFNALFGGKRGETTSARCYRSRLRLLEWFIDKLTSSGHCYRSYHRWLAAETARWNAVIPPRN